MCEFKTLHIDGKVGYVIQCIHCRHITIGFGILTFSRSLSEFYKLVQDTRDCYIHHAVTAEDAKARNIPFWQLNECSCVTLSLNDLYHLSKLLDCAASKLQLSAIISTLSEN